MGIGIGIWQHNSALAASRQGEPKCYPSQMISIASSFFVSAPIMLCVRLRLLSTRCCCRGKSNCRNFHRRNAACPSAHCVSKIAGKRQRLGLHLVAQSNFLSHQLLSKLICCRVDSLCHHYRRLLVASTLVCRSPKRIPLDRISHSRMAPARQTPYCAKCRVGLAAALGRNAPLSVLMRRVESIV